MEIGFTSPRIDCFPAGLRVLLVDDDLTWLKILEKMLIKCSYVEVGPKKIFNLMNVPWLTRENVASHLQKYRLYMSRLQKEKEYEPKTTFNGMKQVDFSSKDPTPESFVLQNSITIHQNNTNFGYPAKKLHIQDLDPKFHESDLNSEIPDPQTSNPQTSSNGSDFGLTYSFESPGTIPTHWNGETLFMQFTQSKSEHKPYLPLEEGYTSLPGKEKPGDPSNFKPISTISTPSSLINQSYIQSELSNLENPLQNLVSFHEESQFYSLQGHGYRENIGLNNVEVLDFDNAELVTELPDCLYDGLRFNCDYFGDTTEYHIMDQGLFII